MWANWAIDASLSRPEETMFCFVPVEEDEEKQYVFITGMNYIGTKCPGKLICIIHPEGQEAVEKWCKRYEKELKMSKNNKQRWPEVCQYCGADRVVRPSGEWQFNCECYDPKKRPIKEI